MVLLTPIGRYYKRRMMNSKRFNGGQSNGHISASPWRVPTSMFNFYCVLQQVPYSMFVVMNKHELRQVTPSPCEAVNIRRVTCKPS